VVTRVGSLQVELVVEPLSVAGLIALYIAEHSESPASITWDTDMVTAAPLSAIVKDQPLHEPPEAVELVMA
jgi:hypothetical protein